MKFGNKPRVALAVPRPIAGILATGLLALAAVPAQAVVTGNVSVTSGTYSDGCYDLLAGQTIPAGEVCFTVTDNNETLLVTYLTNGGWQLTEAHLWVGTDQNGYPAAKNGNPKIGNFPYNSGNITGAVTHSFEVPMGSVIDLDDSLFACGTTKNIFAMAHAAVRLISNGVVIQTETGWSAGEGAVQKGSWATRSAITLSKECVIAPPPPPPTVGQETAIMFGNIVLNNRTDAYCMESVETRKGSGIFVEQDVFAANRWGWQEGPLETGEYTREIWAAAGNNVLANGTHVGNVTINVATDKVTVTPVLFAGFEALETHIYIGTTPVCSGAFGSDWKSTASTVRVNSDPVYVGVHLSVEAECSANGNFCEAPK